MVTPFKKIDSFIEKRKIDLNVKNFYLLSVDCEIDPAFALATFNLETGNGTSFNWVAKNNPAGIKCGTEYCTYDSKDDGLSQMFSLLKSYTTGSIEWVGKRTTIKEVRSKWSESDDSYKILEIMKEVIYG